MADDVWHKAGELEKQRQRALKALVAAVDDGESPLRLERLFEEFWRIQDTHVHQIEAVMRSSNKLPPRVTAAEILQAQQTEQDRQQRHRVRWMRAQEIELSREDRRDAAKLRATWPRLVAEAATQSTRYRFCIVARCHHPDDDAEPAIRSDPALGPVISDIESEGFKVTFHHERLRWGAEARGVEMAYDSRRYEGWKPADGALPNPFIQRYNIRAIHSMIVFWGV